MWFVTLIAVGICALAVTIPTLKNTFETIIKDSIINNYEHFKNIESEVYTEKDIENLPLPIQRYFRYSGLIGKSKIYNSHITYVETDFKLSPEKPMLKIKYQHYNFLNELERVALIETNVNKIPFDGLDNYTNGQGSMTGKIAKYINIFEVRGQEMDISSLVTCLSEMIFLPTVALLDYVIWESIDDHTAKATIKYNTYSVTSTYTVNDNGEMVRVETDDRYMDEGKGKSSRHKWVVELSEYIEENGIRHPSNAIATWMLQAGPYKYFDGKGITIEYNVKE